MTVQKQSIYCLSIYINSNDTIAFGSFKCHKYCKHMIQPEPAVKQKHHTRSPRRDISSILAGCIVSNIAGFQDRKRAACSRLRQNGTRLYLREVILLIYKTPKQSFLPPYFPGAIPFKRTQSFILGSHAHTGPEEKQTEAI